MKKFLKNLKSNKSHELLQNKKKTEQNLMRNF